MANDFSSNDWILRSSHKNQVPFFVRCNHILANGLSLFGMLSGLSKRCKVGARLRSSRSWPSGGTQVPRLSSLGPPERRVCRIREPHGQWILQGLGPLAGVSGPLLRWKQVYAPWGWGSRWGSNHLAQVLE